MHQLEAELRLAELIDDGYELLGIVHVLAAVSHLAKHVKGLLELGLELLQDSY